MNIFDGIEKYSDNTAIVTETSEQITYKQLLELSGLIAKNVKKRCLVFLICSNNVESVAGYFGFIRCKAVPIIINKTINKFFFANLLETYKPEYIFLPTKIYRPKYNFTEVYSLNSYTLFKTKYNEDYALHEDLALLLTTSGSTGSPKLVRQSYKNIYSNAKSIAQYLGITNEDRPITTMPMSYSYGLSIINSHFLKGASIILTEATLMERNFWAIARNNNTTTFSGVPYIYEMLNKLNFDRINLDNLRYITQAGGKLSIELSTTFADICEEKGIKFYVMYGQTEATSRMSYLPWEYMRNKIGSVGIAIPGGKFWLEGENNKVIQKSNTVGELVYQGDNVSMGYAESCFDLQKGDDNNGVLHTGDLALKDDDGFIYITGRIKRFLKMYGNRINIDEIENLLQKAGLECACTGTDDNLMIYLTKPEKRDQILSYIAKITGINWKGFSLVYIDKIPRNDSGKIQYSALGQSEESSYCE